ncbi:hypothetical protein [Sanyastnella coralliicola]|uniref:hypothetical protein n=1 Tax=Sanyastnella coralliicola TaxID=3069118 RepID=UPI0027B8C10A|nr:hypothetical protein [Longitalea sp. SCSIO 12813]
MNPDAQVPTPAIVKAQNVVDHFGAKIVLLVPGEGGGKGSQETVYLNKGEIIPQDWKQLTFLSVTPLTRKQRRMLKNRLK